MRLIAIDPGNIDSAYIIWNGEQVIEKGKVDNRTLLGRIVLCEVDLAVIEMVSSYGMPVGQTVFDTCVWLGMFKREFEQYKIPVQLHFRTSIKLHHCKMTYAKDGNVRQALVDKYGEDYSKKKPNNIYNTANDKIYMTGDLWSAFALATYITENEGRDEQRDLELNKLTPNLL